MIKTILIILAILTLASGALYAKGKVIKTDDGFKIKQTHTYYENKITWGEGYIDHTMGTSITGIAVLAVGTDWTYSTITDKDGIFKVKVKPGEPFNIRVSDGNTWVDYEVEIAAVQEGTTFSELR